MKKIIFILSIAGLLGACNTELKQELETVKNEKMQLEAESRAKDSIVEAFTDALLEIQESLNLVREKESSVNVALEGNMERQPELKQNILQDISAINEILENQKQRIAELNKKLASLGGQMSNLKKMVQEMQTQIEERDLAIEQLNNTLAERDIRISELSEKITTMSAENERALREKENELNKCYYVIGTQKELIDAELIDKKGGFIGLGKVKTLASNLNKQLFTEGDKRKMSQLPLNDVRKAELISKHPEGSFEWVMEGKNYKAIKINDADKFWSTTKFLVLMAE